MLARALAFLVVVMSIVVTACAEPMTPALEISPASRSLVVGETVQLTVTRRFLGGAVEDVTARVAYGTSDRTVATVDDGARRGLVSALDTGAVIIRVYDPGSDATQVVTFDVVAPRIESIEVSPSPAIVVQRGTKRQFTAQAHFSNGSIRDVTAQVSWSSSNEAAAIVGNTTSDKGLVTAVASGDSNIVATDAVTRVQGRTIVFVTGDAPQLKAIVVTPNPGVVGVGKTTQFSAFGVTSDGSTRDVSKEVVWSSSKSANLTIDAAGLATGVAVGDATVTAASADPNGAIKGSAAATIVP